MNMVCHQAIRVQFATQLRFEFEEVFEVVKVVVINSKDRATVMTTVDDVVGIIGNDESADTWHEKVMALTSLMSN
jgi:hypothetical protein